MLIITIPFLTPIPDYGTNSQLNNTLTNGPEIPDCKTGRDKF
jgi:hypothetical protein